MPDSTRAVLLVGPDADAWGEDVPRDGIDLTTTTSTSAARAYLSGTEFDVVFLQEGVGGGDGLRALRDVLGLATPVEQVAAPGDVVRWLAARASGTSEGGGDARGSQAVLKELKRELGRVAHSLNNPLSVIMGNAQLGIELSTATETDENVVAALQSIYEAGGELGKLFGEVAALRDRVDRLLDAPAQGDE